MGSSPITRSKRQGFNFAFLYFNTPDNIIINTCKDDNFAIMFLLYNMLTGLAAIDGNITILYVEDNWDNQTLVHRVLQAEGYQVVLAESAIHAMDVLQEIHPNLILMDINLPEFDGYSLTTHLKMHPDFQDVPIIALTANVMLGDRERSMAAGCDGYIQKPIDVDTLPEQVNRYLLPMK